MRRRYRTDPKTGKLVEIPPRRPIAGVTIMPDIAPFVSPITGKVISGRAALREHNKMHNVTNVADFDKPGGEWDRAAKDRARFYSGDTSYDSERRKEHLIRAFEKHNRR